MDIIRLDMKGGKGHAQGLSEALLSLVVVVERGFLYVFGTFVVTIDVKSMYTTGCW